MVTAGCGTELLQALELSLSLSEVGREAIAVVGLDSTNTTIS